MATHEYQKSTDAVQTVGLTSEIVHANWRKKKAVTGSTAGFEVWTHFVGSGSEIEVEVKDKDGKVHAKVNGNIYGDYFGHSLEVPEKAKEHLKFKAKLSAHGLEKESGIMEIVPPFEVINQKWGQDTVRRGDTVSLSADVVAIPDGTQMEISIYEYDNDGAHDCVTKFPVWVEGGRIESEWEFEYQEDTDDIPAEGDLDPYGRHYSHPEYFWIAVVWDTVFGENQESGLLLFKDDVDMRLLEPDGTPVAEQNFELHLADGSVQTGQLDENGGFRQEDIPPGPFRVTYPDVLGPIPEDEEEENAVTLEPFPVDSFRKLREPDTHENDTIGELADAEGDSEGSQPVQGLQRFSALGRQ